MQHQRRTKEHPAGPAGNVEMRDLFNGYYSFIYLLIRNRSQNALTVSQDCEQLW